MDQESLTTDWHEGHTQQGTTSASELKPIHRKGARIAVKKYEPGKARSSCRCYMPPIRAHPLSSIMPSKACSSVTCSRCWSIHDLAFLCFDFSMDHQMGSGILTVQRILSRIFCIEFAGVGVFILGRDASPTF